MTHDCVYVVGYNETHGGPFHFDLDTDGAYMNEDDAQKACEEKGSVYSVLPLELK